MRFMSVTLSRGTGPALRDAAPVSFETCSENESPESGPVRARLESSFMLLFDARVDINSGKILANPRGLWQSAWW